MPNIDMLKAGARPVVIKPEDMAREVYDGKFYLFEDTWTSANFEDYMFTYAIRADIGKLYYALLEKKSGLIVWLLDDDIYEENITLTVIHEWESTHREWVMPIRHCLYHWHVTNALHNAVVNAEKLLELDVSEGGKSLGIVHSMVNGIKAYHEIAERNTLMTGDLWFYLHAAMGIAVIATQKFSRLVDGAQAADKIQRGVLEPLAEAKQHSLSW